jgi:hypothetical protein
LREGEVRSRALAERILAYESGDSPDPVDIVATERVCSKLRDVLGPVIGEAGVSAVMVRAAKVTWAEFPCLHVTVTPEQSNCLAGLRESLNGQAPDRVAEALTALVANSLKVLYSLLGRDLTHRLIGSAWSDLDIP